MDFDERDLTQTARRIRERLEAGEESLQLLKELLDAAEAQRDLVNDHMLDIESSQQAIMKSLLLLSRHGARVDKRLETMTKGLASVSKGLLGLATWAKSIPVAGRPQANTQVRALSLEEEAKRGMVAKALVNVFGRHGGHALQYNPALAWRMMQAGTLTQRENATWKKSHRMPDGPWASLQKTKAG